MNDTMVKQLTDAVRKASYDRHKLVLVLGDFGSGKTFLLRNVADRVGGKYINLNLQLTERLRQLARARYNDGVTVHQEIDRLCDEESPDGQPLFVDNIELLFSPELGKVNPVDTFKRISRQRVVVLAIPARRDGSYAEYASIDRPDYMQMEIGGYIVIDLEDGSR